MKSLLRLWSQFCKRALQNIVGLFCKKQTPKQTPTNPRVQSRPAMFALPQHDIVGLFCRTDTNNPSFAKQTPAKPLLQNRHQQNVLCNTDLIYLSHTWYCRALLQYRHQQSLFYKTNTNQIACAKQPLYVCHIHDIVGGFLGCHCQNTLRKEAFYPHRGFLRKNLDNSKVPLHFVATPDKHTYSHVTSSLSHMSYILGTHTFMGARVSARTHMYICMHTHVGKHVHMHTHIHIHIHSLPKFSRHHTYIHIHLHTLIHVNIHAHAHIHTCPKFSHHRSAEGANFWHLLYAPSVACPHWHVDVDIKVNVDVEVEICNWLVLTRPVGWLWFVGSWKL